MNESLPPLSRERFLDETTTINLRRIWWVIIFSGALNFGIFLFNLLQPAMRIMPLSWAQVMDFGCSALFLLAAWILSRNPRARFWRRAYVVLFAVAVLAVMDYYYFALLPVIGTNGCYILGIVTIGVVILLSPSVLFPILAINHLAFCLLVLASVRDTLLRSTVILDGTAGLLVACLAGWFLYAARLGDFRKGKIIAERNRELEDRHEEMNELMAITAHDLRSPLFGLRNWLETAASQPQSHHLLSPLNKAAATCRNMLALIERLLLSHSAESGIRNLSLSREDLRLHAAAAVDRHRPEARSREILLTSSLGDRPAFSQIQPAALAQVFDNLLTNALKFSPPGATVGLTLLEDDGHWIATVGDEGPGIPIPDRERLFRKFHRGSSPSSDAIPGTGLGLFIVRKLMEAMSGSVSYAPREPTGSLFLLRFKPSPAPAGEA